MQFKNPEVLYFLALLIIPILIHLFQLQKFVKVPFTNVAFLQQIQQQTRKSSRIKKWLILACRLLLFSAILFAFSQPYFSNKELVKKQQNFIYLDNSLSLNAKGEKGNLLQIAIQDIINNSSENDAYYLQTNSDFHPNLSKKELKETLLNLKNYSKPIDLASIKLRFEQKQKSLTNTLHKVFYISDLQNKKYNEFTNVTGGFSVIKLNSATKSNLSIDSVSVKEKNSTNFTLQVFIRNQGEAKNNVPIAVYNRQKLISKLSFSIAKNSKKNIEFNLQNQSTFQGKIEVTFSDTFSFDNSFYFTLKEPKKINILSIGNDLDFLKKIYSKDEFNYTFSSIKNTNYNLISKQDLIILSEPEIIPEILSNRLLEFSKNGGNIVFIPNAKGDITNYNQFFNKHSFGRVSSPKNDSLKITTINFSHPLFKNVFSKQVKNFQYPVVNTYYSFKNFKPTSSILSFENNLPFIQEFTSKKGRLFLVASPLNRSTTNFMNSPLVVPVFYNFAQASFKKANLFYRLYRENNIDIETTTNKDEVLVITRDNANFIPLQRRFQEKVSITTKDSPQESGFYYILKNKDTLQTIAFNNPKNESSLLFLDEKRLKQENKNITVSNSIVNSFQNLNKKNEVHWLWKWFLALAIVSLLLEILILKFYKT